MVWLAPLQRRRSRGLGDVFKEAIIERLTGIGALVVIGISEVCRIGQHDRLISIVPVGFVVAAQGILEKTAQAIGAEVGQRGDVALGGELESVTQAA